MSSSPSSSDISSVRTMISKKNATGNKKDEYLTRKEVQVKTTKNTEKFVRRKIVLEDGRVLEEEDPHVVVDTVQDTRTHKFNPVDDKDLDPELRAILHKPYAKSNLELKHYIDKSDQGSSLSKIESDCNDIINDSFKRTVNSKDVKERIVKTQVAQDLGLMSRRGIERVLSGKETLKDVLDKQKLKVYQQNTPSGYPIVQTYQTGSRKKIVDTEDVRNVSRRMKNGNIKTETIRSEKHEVFDDRISPDDERSTISREVKERDAERYFCTKKDKFTDFYHSGNENCKSQLICHGPHVTTEERKIITRKRDEVGDWDEVSDERIRIRRQQMREKLCPGESLDRTDALTKMPLNFFKEEKTRQKETDRWLHRHFGGSEWSLITRAPLRSGISTFGVDTLRKAKFLDSMGLDEASRHDETNLRRSQSFGAVPWTLNYPDSNFDGDRVVRRTTTMIHPGVDKVVYSSVKKAVAAAPSYITEERGLSNEKQKIYKSAVSLTNIVKKKDNASAKATSREVPIVIKQEFNDKPSTKDRSRTKTSENLAEKDLSFYQSSKSTKHQLRDSTSYNDLARASMINSTYLRQQHDLKNPVFVQSTSGSSKKESKSKSISREKSPTVYETSTLRISRTKDKSNNDNVKNPLRVQSLPPSKSKSIQASNEKVHLIYSNIDKRDPEIRGRDLKQKRDESNQPILWADLEHRKNKDKAPRMKFSDMLGDSLLTCNSPSLITHNFTKSFGDLNASKSEKFERREEYKHVIRSSGKTDGIGKLENPSFKMEHSSYKNIERSDGDIWNASNEWSGYKKSNQSEEDSQHSNTSLKQQLIEPPPFYRTSSDSREFVSKKSSKENFPRQLKGSKTYEFEKRIPLHSSSLEAQKFKTIVLNDAS